MRRFINISIVYLLTAATIVYEISLSRLFSYILSYHFVLIIIAFAILGLGIGQMLYSKYSASIDRRLVIWYGLLPIGLAIAYVLIQYIPKIGLFSSPVTSLFTFIVVAFSPFILIGIIYAHIFEQNKHDISILYGIDLVGAASGAIISVYLLNTIGLGKVVFITILLLLLVVVAYVFQNQKKFTKIALAVFFGIALTSWWISVNLNVEVSNDPSKDMLRLINNPSIESKVIDSDWNAFGKTDLLSLEYPGGEESLVMFIDGAAGTNVVSIDELSQNTHKKRQSLARFPADFAMSFLQKEAKDTALIIGPGGGIDIASAYFLDFAFIEAVEVNPSFVNFMKKHNPSTFVNKNRIKVYINEGRNFVRKNKQKYDAILLTIPVTKSGRGVDFYGLTENYLFTVEALIDYMEGLTNEGAIFFTMHGRHEVYRMLSNYLALQDQRGVKAKEALKAVYIFSNGMNPVLVIKKTPFDENEIEEVHLNAHQLGLDEDVFFFPLIPQISIDTVLNDNVNYAWYMFDNLIYDISIGTYPYQYLYESSVINIEPVFDDSPYFFNYNKGIPDSLSILVLLGLGILLWFFFRLIRGWESVYDIRNVSAGFQQKFRYLVSIAFLMGFSYFFIQGYLFQILNLKLSSPSQSFSLLLFTFLLGNGLGSFLTGSFKTGLIRKFIIYTTAIIVASSLTGYVLIPAFEAQLSEIGITAILLLPSFFIGIPFPTLLKIGREYAVKNTIPILLGVSSIAGVGASIFAIIISLVYGYQAVFIIGLFGYGLLILLAIRLQMIEKDKNSYKEINVNK